MNNKFEMPIMEVILLKCDDIIRTSKMEPPVIEEDDTEFEPT